MKFKTWQIIVIVLCILAVTFAVLWKTGVIDNIVKSFQPVQEETEEYPEEDYPEEDPEEEYSEEDYPEEYQSEEAIFDRQMEQTLTVNLNDATINSLYTEYSWEYLDNCSVEKDKARVKMTGLSDAVSFPLSENPEKAFRQVLEEVLRNPVYGDMVARGLGGILLPTGKRVYEINPWIIDFVNTSNEYYSKSINEHPVGLEGWLTYRYGTDGRVDTSTIYVSKEYRNYAVRTCVLLERLVNKGFKEYKSIRNYALNFVADNCYRRTELATYEEDKLSLILSFARKDNKYSFVIGFNALDRRFEIFQVGDPEPTPTTKPTKKPRPTNTPKPTNTPNPTKKPKPTNTPAPTSVPTNTPAPTSVPTNTPTPTSVPTNTPAPTSVPTNTPAPTATPKPTEEPGTKNPAVDPAEQGAAPIYGGENKPEDKSGVQQTENPATPVPTSVPTNTPAPTPTQAPVGPTSTPVTITVSETVPVLDPHDSIANDIATGNTIVVSGDLVVDGEINLDDIP